MPDQTETADPAVDFDGCNSECRKAGAHTLRWGGCEHATQPEPTVSMSKVYVAEDGYNAIGFDTYTVPELARLIEGALRSAPFQELRSDDYVNGPLVIKGYLADLAQSVARVIVHRNDGAAPAIDRSDVGAEFVHQTDHPDEAGLAAFETDLAGQGAPKADSKAAAVASCPGYETSPNPCRCPCYGCKHHCGAHQPDDVDDTDLTETDIDRMMATGTPVQIITAPPQTSAAGHVTVSEAQQLYEPDEDPASVRAAFDRGEKGVTTLPADKAERRDRYALALHRRGVQLDDAGSLADMDDPQQLAAIADAAMAVADAEQAELRAEVARLGDWVRSVTARAKTARAERDRVHDELVTNEADRVAAVGRAKTAEAAVDRVRQLHDRLAEETDLTSPDDEITRGAAAELIATALDGDQPPAATPTAAEIDDTPPMHGCTIGGKPAMPILVDEYNRLVVRAAEADASRAATITEAADAMRAYTTRYGPSDLTTAWAGAIRYLRWYANQPHGTPAGEVPVDRTELRDRIAGVLRPHASLGGTPPRCEVPFFDGATPSLPRISGWRPLDDVATSVLAVIPDPASTRANALREAADALDADMERFFAEYPEEPRNSPYALGRKDAATELRRLADEPQQPKAVRCACPHPADEHSIYGCVDGCACEWMPKRPPMDPIHILGIEAEAPAVPVLHAPGRMILCPDCCAKGYSICMDDGSQSGAAPAKEA